MRAFLAMAQQEVWLLSKSTLPQHQLIHKEILIHMDWLVMSYTSLEIIRWTGM